MPIDQTEGYKKLERGSMFRLENFERKIAIHVPYIQQKQQNKHRKENFNKILKVGAVVIAASVILIGLKYGRNSIASNL